MNKQKKLIRQTTLIRQDEYLNLRSVIEEKIKENGGWVNCHAHIDRAFTVNSQNFRLYNASIKEKWNLNDNLKRISTVEQYYDRMAAAIELMISQGVTAIGTFIDIDEIVKDKVVKAAIKLRDRYKKDIAIKYINQVHRGVLTPSAKKWFMVGAEFADIVGGLPSTDHNREGEHLDVLLQTAKQMGKMVHVHVDQLNSPLEKETELLAVKTIMHGMEGKVVGIHGVSIAAHPKEYRQQLYALMKAARLMMVSCPFALIDSRRFETKVPSHNSILPVDELIPEEITVALGTDNISDIYLPFGNGSMVDELRLLAAACRFTDIESLIKIATDNGRRILGLEINKRNIQPFYDPMISYEDNFRNGPFGAFKDNKITDQSNTPAYNFLGHKLYLPFGIPAGPLVNGKFVKAALEKGFDLATYKTVRTKQYSCHPWPNVLGVRIKENLTIARADQPLIATTEYSEPLSITNSFGVPSYDPDLWQKDMHNAVESGKNGQLVIGSFQGTPKGDGDVKEYIKDFVKAAVLVKETGTKVLEANLSCPNEGTAHLLCYDLERTRLIADAIKNEVGNIPLILKLAYFPDQIQLKKLIKITGNIVQGFAVINTIPAAIVDEKGNQALPGKGRLRSGVCGYAIKWAGVEMVKRMKAIRDELSLSFVIVGVGGVTKPEDYKEYIISGADAVMSATGAMWNPYLAIEIKKMLKLQINQVIKQDVRHKVLFQTNGKAQRKPRISADVSFE